MIERNVDLINIPSILINVSHTKQSTCPIGVLEDLPERSINIYDKHIHVVQKTIVEKKTEYELLLHSLGFRITYRI